MRNITPILNVVSYKFFMTCTDLSQLQNPGRATNLKIMSLCVLGRGGVVVKRFLLT